MEGLGRFFKDFEGSKVVYAHLRVLVGGRSAQNKVVAVLVVVKYAKGSWSIIGGEGRKGVVFSLHY